VPVPPQGESRSNGDLPAWTFRVAKLAVGLIFVSAAVAILGGFAVAVGWSPGDVEQNGNDDQCVTPPCPPESLPDLASLPVVLPVVLLGFAMICGGLVFLMAASRVKQGSGRSVVSGLVLIAGPILILAGTEVIPHGVNPCFVRELPHLCTETNRYGVDYADRVHALGHATIGALPLTVGFWWLLRRWRPELLPHRPSR